MAARVSVIIPAFNRAAFVVKAVRGALSQHCPGVEVIVVDDGSTDQTREVLAPYANRITYLFQANAGQSHARNTGFHASSGMYVVFLDSDDELDLGAVEAGVQALERHPRYRAAYGRAMDVEPDGAVISEWRTPTRTGNLFSSIVTGLTLQVGQCVFRRDLLQELSGPFDASVRVGEDLHLLLRLSRHHEFVFVPQVFVKRMVHRETLTRGRRDTDIMERRLRFLQDIFGQAEAAAIRRRYLGRRTFAEWYRTSGFQKASVKEMPGARKLMIASLTQWPFQPRLYGWFIYHGLPTRIQGWLRRLKRGGEVLIGQRGAR